MMRLGLSMLFSRTNYLVLLIVPIMAGCALPTPRSEIDSVSSLGKDEVIVAGRFELLPPLKKGEQRIKALNSGSFINQIFIYTDDHNRKLSRDLSMSDFEGVIAVTLGENFYVRSSNKPFYIIGGSLYLTDTEKVFFPGGAKISLQPNDKAVYIGTIQFHRDEFMNIKKIEVIDDFDRVNSEFRKKFGAKLTLRKAFPAAGQ